MSAKLAVVRTTTEDLSVIFGYFNDLEGMESECLARIHDASDEELILTRQYAKSIGRSAWRIECACDAELVHRVHAAVGRGKKDVEGKGVKAAIAKQAAEIGCHPRTIERNGEIHRLTQEIDVNDHANLEDKGFFEAALRSNDPRKALDLFSEKKAANAFYSVRDAWKDAERLKRKATAKVAREAIPESLRKIQDDALRKHIDYVLNVIISDFKVNCPSPEFAAKLYDPWIEELEFERNDIGDHDLREEILKAWKHGSRTTGEITEAVTGSADDVSKELLAMESLGIIERVRQGGETDEARGSRPTLWHLVGEPIGSSVNIPKQKSIYAMGDRE